MMSFLLLVAGLAGLIIGAHLVIRGSLNIANHFKISQVFIGLTILAIGTDLPELLVNITASIERLGGTETSGLVIGSTMGTVMGQLTLTLGVVGVFMYLTMSRRLAWRDGIVLLASIILLFLVGLDGEISRIEGAVFVVVYLIYFYLLQREEKVFSKVRRAEKMHLFWAMLSLVAGFAILIYSSDLTVGSSLKLADAWGIRQSLVGVLLVGLGSSLPEIILSLQAIIKKAPALSVGNLIGSNIFDLLFALGIGSAISGFAFDRHFLLFDIPYLFFAAIIVVIFFLRKKGIQKKEAIVLLGIWLGYIVLKVLGM